MADTDVEIPNYESSNDDEFVKVKIICLGDSAVGKSKYDHLIDI